MHTKKLRPSDSNERACNGRRSNSPHRHRLQHETQFEGHRYAWTARKTTTGAHTGAKSHSQPRWRILLAHRPETRRNQTNQRKDRPGAQVSLDDEPDKPKRRPLPDALPTESWSTRHPAIVRLVVAHLSAADKVVQMMEHVPASVKMVAILKRVVGRVWVYVSMAAGMKID